MKKTYLHDGSPEVRDAPVLTHANDDVKVARELVAGVERNPPETVQVLVVAPEPGCGNRWVLCCEETEECEEDEEGKADASTNTGFRAVSNADTESLGSDESKGEDEVARPADLVGDILAAVQRCCGKALAPDDEEEGHVVDVGVDCVQGLKTELGAVDERNESGYDCHGSVDDPAREPLAPVGVQNHRRHDIEEGESRGETQQEQGEEEDDREEGCTGHLSQSLWVGDEASDKGAELCATRRVDAQVSNDAKHGKRGDDLDSRVAESNNESILDSVGVL